AAERLIVRVRSDDQERGSGIDGRNARRGSRHVGPRRRAGCGQAEGGGEEEEEGAAAPGNDGHGGPECTISWRWIRAPARPSAALGKKRGFCPKLRHLRRGTSVCLGGA